MNAFAIAGLILGITSSCLALIVFLYGRTKLHRIWAFFNIAVAIWGFGCFMVGQAGNAAAALVTWKFAHIGGIFVGVLFYQMVCEFCELNRRRSIVAAYAVGIVFLFLNLATDLLINKIRYVFNSLYYNDANALFSVLVFLWLFIVAWSFAELIRYLPKTKGIKRTQTIYIITGFLVGFLGGTSTFFPEFHIDFLYPFGNFTIPIYCLISTYAILRYRLMDINLVFKKGIVYSLSAGILTCVFLLIILTMTRLFSDMVDVNSFQITAVAAIIIAVLFNPLKNSIQRLVDKKFYKRSYDYYSTIKHVSSTLASMFNRNNIFKFIGDTVYEILGLEGVYVLAAVPAEGIYEAVYHISKDGGSSMNALTENNGKFNIDEKSEALKIFDKSRDLIVKDELPLLEEKFGLDVVEEIRKDMEKFKGEVLIPIFVDSKLSFLIVLGEKLSGDMFTNEDINMLSTISDQMVISLKNAQLYSGKVQTERLASIGMMSATFAHEIRNPLTSLKTFAQLMPEKYNDLEFRDTFSKIVVGEIEKIDTLIGDLLDFSTEKKAVRVNNFNIVELVDETLDYIKGKVDSKNKNIDVVKLYHENVIDMSGDATKLKQAFGIIIMNGYQAMNGSGKLTVSINRHEKKVDVAITDTGEGIRHEDISRIFDPFVTTKEMGVGLGLAITKRVIDDHEGKIHVRSRLAEGTTFTISLPVKI